MTNDDVFNEIKKFIKIHKLSPTYMELAEKLRVTRQAIYKHIHRLEQRGLITFTPSVQRSIKIKRRKNNGY